MLLNNYYRWLASLLDRRGETFRDVTGTDRSLNLGIYASWCNAGYATYWIEANSPEGNTDYGIVVGISDAPVTLYDYYINKITHGTSSGQLYYYATEVRDVVVSGNVVELELRRKLLNKTSDDVVVNEFGVIVRARDYYFLIAREVSPTTVPSQGLLEVSFKFKTTV